MIRVALALVFLTCVMGLAAMPAVAQDPAATAQAADQWASHQQWRANQAAAAAQSARATADTAWLLATAQAAEATVTAQWVATATPAAATAQAQATQDALAVEGTRQAIYAQATQTAHDQAVQATAAAQSLEVTATKAAAIAEQDQLFIEMDRLTLERSRRLAPLYTWGPWVMTAVCVALATWAVRRLIPVLQERLRAGTIGLRETPPPGCIDIELVAGEFMPGPFCTPPGSMVSTHGGRWRPLMLRPIAPGQRQRREKHTNDQD